MSRTFVQGVEPRTGTVATAYRLFGTLVHPTDDQPRRWDEIAPFTSVVTAAGTAGDIAASSATSRVGTRPVRRARS